MDLGGLLDISRRADDSDTSFYGYVPDRATAIVFLVLFSISTVAHIGQAVTYRTWWMLGTAVLCGLLEILGWVARLWSSYNPGLDVPYEMQLTCTILGPTPLLAANFVIMEHLINRLGSGYSRLTPKWYIILFCCCDILSLVVQAIGGGSAADAVSTDGDPEKGGHIMLGGIVFQMVTITVYALCATEFFFRYFSDKPIPGRGSTRGHLTLKLKLLSGAVVFSTVLLFIRAVYRTIELADGWTGRIIETEVYFNVLDGAMVIVAIYTVNILHPGLLLRTKAEKDLDTEMTNVGPSSPMPVPASSSNTTLAL
ncbi:RTA1-like protein [Hymenopellis radicata]|nr:RTA1-like protein [Hymenopellis radicata]